MPCDTVVPVQDFIDAVRELEDKLGGDVDVKVDPASGAVALSGWENESRRGVTDVCAINRMMVDNSMAWQQALAQAETIAGRQMDMTVLAAGVHSHDGGATWNEGH